MGQAIICLQEVPRWTAGRVIKGLNYVVHSSRTKHDEANHRDGFDCGFLVPGGLNPLVRDECYGQYWGGMVLNIGPHGHTLFFSVHFIHKNRDGAGGEGADIIDDIRQGTLEYYSKCRRRFGPRISVTAGFDANVTLPADIEHCTGTATLQPLKSHSSVMQQRILGWLQLVGLRALNTYGDVLAPSELWTCGVKRKAPLRSQIDFIGVTDDLIGSAAAVNFLDLKGEHPLIAKMDHRPVKAELSWDANATPASSNTSCVQQYRDKLPRRGFSNTSIQESFRRQTADNTLLELDLDDIEKNIRRIARSCYDAESADTETSLKPEFRKIAGELRQRIRFEACPNARKELMRRLWKVLHAMGRLGAMKKLSSLKKHGAHMQFTPQAFKINGVMSYDRQQWLDGACDFGQERFGDGSNTTATQLKRLESLRVSADNDRLDGFPECHLEFFDTLQARSRLKPGTAAGIDDITPDVYLELPFVAIAHIHQLFERRTRFQRMAPSSAFWKILEFVGLPKSAHPTCFSQLRWICKSAVLQKWYLHTLRPHLRHQLRPSIIHSYGFRERTSASDLTGMVRELLHVARTWGYSLILSVQDVRTAFDSMPHDLIGKSLRDRGASARMTGLHLRELTTIQAYMRLPFAGETPLFDYQKGGKQGGVETPDEWRAMIEYIMQPVVTAWNQLGFGFKASDGEDLDCIINHAIWADNIVLIADSFETMQTMINQLDAAFAHFRDASGRRYFNWKRDSLEVVAAGALKEHDSVELFVFQDGERLAYVEKDRIILLGECLNCDGSTKVSVEFNQGRAEMQYFKHQQILRNRALPVGKRLKAWHSTAATTATYNSSTWHLTGSILASIRTWELQMLRRLLGLRRRPQETFRQHNERTAVMIVKWMRQNGLHMVFQRVLKNVYKAAYKVDRFTLDSGDAPLKHLLRYHEQAWWQTLAQIVPPTKRLKIGMKHRHAGCPPASWEQPFVAAWGIHWRSRLDKARTLPEWMSQWPEFLRILSTEWKLPFSVEAGRPISIGDALQTFRLPTTEMDVPPLMSNPRADWWCPGGGRLWIQTDNQQVEQIMLGKSDLKIGTMRPLCVRVGRMLEALLKCGRRPRIDTAPFVEWDPRKYNTLADHAANVALDKQSGWMVQDACALQAVDSRTNYRLCIDGAVRGDGAAAAGLALLLYGPSHNGRVLYRGGCLLGNLNSAFLAEMLALEWALTRFSEWFNAERSGI